MGEGDLECLEMEKQLLGSWNGKQERHAQQRAELGQRLEAERAAKLRELP